MAITENEIKVDVVAEISGYQSGMQAAAKVTKDFKTSVDEVGASAEESLRVMDRYDRVGGRVRQLQADFKALSDAAKQGLVGADDAGRYERVIRSIQAESSALNALDGQVVKHALSEKQLANAMSGVPAQFTDIFTSIAAGQPPVQVFLQQGGQLKDMFGGVGGAAKAAGGYLLRLINPYTAAAAAVVGLAVAYHQGSKESEEFSNALILTGNSAGTSVGKLEALAGSVAHAAESTKGAAADALTQLVSAGNVSEQNLGKAAAAAVEMEGATGKAIAASVQEFSELGKAPVQASIKLNEQYHYLTGSVFAQIKALEDQGRSTAAANLAESAYADAVSQRAKNVQANLGTLETAWKNVWLAARQAWDGMLDIGRETPVETQLSAVQKRLEQLRTSASSGPDYLRDSARSQIPALEHELSVLQAQLAARNKTAEAAGDEARRNDAQIKWMQEGDKYLSRQQQMEKEIVAARNLGNQAGENQAAIEKRIADIREKYAEKPKAVPKSRSADDYDTKLLQKIRSEIDQTDVVKARELADTLAKLDDLAKRGMDPAIVQQVRDKLTGATAAQQAYETAVRAALDPLYAQSEALARQNENYGKTEEEIQRTTAARIDEAAAMAAANGASPETIAFLQKEAQLRRDIAAGASTFRAKQLLDTPLEQAARKRDADRGALITAASTPVEQGGIAMSPEELKAQLQRVEADYTQTVNDIVRKNQDALFQGLLTEEERVRQSYERRREDILNLTDVTESARQDALQRLEKDFDDKRLRASGEFWDRWLVAAQDHMTSMDKVVGDALSNMTSKFGSLFESVVFDSTSAQDAFAKFAEGMARSLVNALGQMAAQWVAYKLVQAASSGSAAAAGATAQSLNAQAKVIEAGLNAFASTAAIPIVGPELAPAAAAAAVAATEPMAAAIAGFATAAKAAAGFSGAYDLGGGIPVGSVGLVGERGPELVRGPAQVTSRRDTARILERAAQAGAGQPAAAPQFNQRVIVAFDQEHVRDAMRGPAGEDVWLVHARANPEALRSIAAA